MSLGFGISSTLLFFSYFHVVYLWPTVGVSICVVRAQAVDDLMLSR